MIRLIVLGSGGAMPTPKSIPAGYAVKYGGTFLFECPEGCQRQMMKYGANYGSLRAIFLSHLHADHFLGLFGLMQTLTLNGRKEELEIYGPKGTKKLFEAVFAIDKLKPGFPLKIKDVVASREKKIFEEKLFAIKAFPVAHGCPSLGFILEANETRNFDEKLAKSKGIHGPLFTEIQEKGSLTIEGKKIKLEDVTFVKQGKKIVFSGDTMPCASLEKAAENADLLVCDSCFSEKHAD
ncbi:MAG: MBL fold metallo-hydrolase, partial [Candidatus Micrarchaeota archaeon]